MGQYLVGCGAGFLDVGMYVGAAGSGRRSRSAQARSRERSGRAVPRALWGFELALSPAIGGAGRRCGCWWRRMAGQVMPDRRYSRDRGWPIRVRLGSERRMRPSGIGAGGVPTHHEAEDVVAGGAGAHDVSIRITIGVGQCSWVARLRHDGISPRAKTSMMSMRLPQHGQARGCTRSV